jgi:5-formaminoimidazole-4-carboxamide-1-(beta)-D-ribofuranosyl 5'-monophosphate synthetase
MADKPKIATFASHTALQILKGAKDEGFETLLLCPPSRKKFYSQFPIVDIFVELESMKNLDSVVARLKKENAILVPHGSFVAYGDLIQLQKLDIQYFGNRKILPLESNRKKEREWLKKAGIKIPRLYDNPSKIDGPVIVKFFGAEGGRGYFLTKNEEDFNHKIQRSHGKGYQLQEYIIGVPMYVHFFQSPLTGELEIMSCDRRWETNVDAIGRITAKDQVDLGLESSYTVVGNAPLVLRESLLPGVLEMGEKVVKASKKLVGEKGLFGPFSLEGVLTPQKEFFIFEISARIVAGTNVYMDGSPYTTLRYNKPVSTGRRVAMEIKQAIQENRLNDVLQ